MNPSIPRIPLILLCIALLLGACSKTESVEEQFESKLVLDITLEAGLPISNVTAHSLTDLHGNTHEVSGLDIMITSDEGHIQLEEDTRNPGVYLGPEDALIMPGVEYSLSTSFKEETISAQTVIPPTMEALQSSKQFIDAEIEGDLVFLEWSGLNTGTFNQYFYVLELTPTDEDPESITRSGVRGISTSVVAYNAEATLSIADFHYYGSHSVKVYALDKIYEPLFKAQTDQSTNGPTNISGAYGYFLGASSVQTEIEIR